jgi:hypothetical protein
MQTKPFFLPPSGKNLVFFLKNTDIIKLLILIILLLFNEEFP